MHLITICFLLTGWQSPAQPPAAAGVDPVKQPSIALEYFAPVQNEAKVPTTLEQALAQALVNHPDMRLVEAEMRVAEAKLAQARIAVSQKVAEEFHKLEKERADVELAKAKWEQVNQLYKKSMISSSELKAAQHELSASKARLAATESSWKLMMGKQLGQTGEQRLILNHYMNNNVELLYQPRYKAMIDLVGASSELQLSGENPTGSMEQLKSHLEVKVKLDKQEKLDLDQAFQKVTVGAGLKVRVKLPVTENKTIYRDVTRLDLDANEFPLHTWLQLIVDEMNAFQAMSAPQRKEVPKRFDLYVREYGLLLTSQDLAPSDAITVSELVKQLKFEKAAKANRKAQESETPKK